VAEGLVRTSQASSVLELLSTPALASNLWRHRELTWQLTKREVLARNKGASLGVLWTVLVPLLTLVVYAFVFGVVFTSRWSDRPGAPAGSFVLPMFCGVTLFNVFAECVTRAPTLILERPNYVKRVVFPVEVLPLSVLGAALILSIVNVVLLLVVQAVMLGEVPLTVAFFPLVMLPLAMLSLGLAWFVASLGVFVRDIRNLVSVLVSPVLFFLSPVFYPIEQIPEPFRPIVALNPLTPILEDARRTILGGSPPHWARWAGVTALSLVVMQLGYAWFMKSKRGFADVI
jgi:lipopolysaccharide transport system permease protein